MVAGLAYVGFSAAITTAITAPIALLIGGAACFVAEAIFVGISVGIAFIASKIKNASQKGQEQPGMGTAAIQQGSNGAEAQKPLNNVEVMRKLADRPAEASSAPTVPKPPAPPVSPAPDATAPSSAAPSASAPPRPSTATPERPAGRNGGLKH